ncbi:hypothetical protein [Ktedonobacter robiniae]
MLSRSGATIKSIAWSPNNQFIAFGDENGVIRVWKV